MLAAAVSSVIFGFSFLFSRLALKVAAPSVLLSARFLFAVLLMLAMVLAGKGKLSLRGKPVGLLLLLGFFEPVLYFVCETYGILHSTATFSGVMIALIPIASLIFAAIFLRERPSLGQVLCSLLSIAGVIVLALLQTGEGTVDVCGVLFLIGAIAAAVAYNLLGRRLSTTFTPFERTFAIMVEGAVFFTIVALIEGVEAPLLSLFKMPTFFLPILYLGGLSSVAAFFLVNYSITYLPISRTTAFANLTTMVSVFAGVVFLGEPLTPLSAISAIAIVLGVWGVQKLALRKN